VLTVMSYTGVYNVFKSRKCVSTSRERKGEVSSKVSGLYTRDNDFGSRLRKLSISV